MYRSLFKGMAFALVLAASSVSANVQAPFGDLVTVEGVAVDTQADIGKGKWSLVMIWATDCHVCAEMKPELSKFHDKHKNLNAEVYGIALDGHKNHEAVKQYMVEHAVTFPTFVGEIDLIAFNFEINSQEPLRGTPTYLLFNPAGEMTAIDYGMLDVSAVERFIERNS